MTFKALADLTRHHPETVRRYMRGQYPSLAFVLRLCKAMSISPHWLFTGEGSKTLTPRVPPGPFSEMPTSEIFEAIATELDALVSKVDRLEARLSAIDGGDPTPPNAAAPGPPDAPAPAST